MEFIFHYRAITNSEKKGTNMIYFWALLSVAVSFKVFDWIWQWAGIPYEGVVALRGLYLFGVWVVVVMMSFSHGISNNIHYRRFFGSNEKRWCLLVGIVFSFFIYCACVGRGQPLLRSIYESILEGASEVQESGGITSEASKRIWNLLELDNFKEVLIPKSQHEADSESEGEEEESPRRAYFGLASWSHWSAFIFIAFNTLLYTLAMRREEIGAWIERKKHEREEERRVETKSKDGKEGPSSGWQVADVFLDAYEVLSKVAGWVYRKAIR